MGKHGRGYARMDRDLYPTQPGWVVPALAEHFPLRGLRAWEPACGTGEMADALLKAGVRSLFATDIVDHGYHRFDGRLDYTAEPLQTPKSVDVTITNPPYGDRGKLAEAFIERGIERLSARGRLILLLPADFDAASTRAKFFGRCPHYAGKIVLTRRIKWFDRPVPCKPCRGTGKIMRLTCFKCGGAGGKEIGPKENHAWYVYAKDRPEFQGAPRIMYAPRSAA